MDDFFDKFERRLGLKSYTQITNLSCNILFLIINLFVLKDLWYLSEAVYLSFLLNLIMLFFMMLRFSYSTNLRLFDVTTFVFFYIFLFLAPICQTINSNYPNTMPYNADLVVKTNLLFFLFFLSSEFAKILNIQHLRNYKNWQTIRLIWIKPFVFQFFLCITFIVFIVSFKYISHSIFLGNHHIQSVSRYLILHKFLFMLPGFCAAYLIIGNMRRNRQGKTLLYLLTIILVLIWIWLKNPFIEHRNAFGTILLFLSFLFFGKKLFTIHSHNITIATLLIFLILFPYPAFKIITHYSHSIGEIKTEKIVELLNVSSNFQSLDFDAWSNAMGTIDYVSENGPLYGKQLLGTMLFFIPRQFWPSKPEGTGGVVADHLIGKYAMWFRNISNPLPSEAFIDFGIIGVIIYGFFYGILSNSLVLKKKVLDFEYVKVAYFSSSVFFLLRGDLISSFSYILAGILALYFIPLTLSKLNA